MTQTTDVWMFSAKMAQIVVLFAICMELKSIRQLIEYSYESMNNTNSCRIKYYTQNTYSDTKYIKDKEDKEQENYLFYFI
jgi:hypothetical protein